MKIYRQSVPHAGLISYQPGLEQLAGQLAALGYKVADVRTASASTTHLYCGRLTQALRQAHCGTLLVDVTGRNVRQVADIVDRRVYSPLLH